MAVIVALLRGVNIGGRHKVGTVELGALWQSFGLGRARTHLQSRDPSRKGGTRPECGTVADGGGVAGFSSADDLEARQGAARQI